MNDCIICLSGGYYKPSILKVAEAYRNLLNMVDAEGSIVAVWKRKKLQPKISFDGGKKYLELICHPIFSCDFNSSGLLDEDSAVQEAQQIINEGK